MKPNTEGLRLIVGDPATTELSGLILNLILFSGILVGGYFAVADLPNHRELLQLILDVIILLTFLALYLFSRIRRRTRLVAHLASILAYVLLVGNYFLNAGMEGPTLLVLTVVLTLVNLVHSLRTSIVYFAIGMVVAVGSIMVEYWHPDWVRPYGAPESRQWDWLSTFLFASLMAFFVMRLVMRFFEVILETTKRAQSAVVQTEKMAALGEILASVSHDINSPVSVIGAHLEASRSWWREELPKAAPLLAALTPRQLSGFWSLVSESNSARSNTSVDFREFRDASSRLLVVLKGLGEPRASTLADNLVLGRVTRWNPEWDPLLEDEAGWSALEFAAEGLLVEHSSRNATEAYRKLLHLVEALRSYSRSERPDAAPVPTSVMEGLDTVLLLYASTRSTTVRVIKNYRADPLVMGRADELIQAWTNLVQNALQAMNNEGTLTVTLDTHDGEVEVSISDTGPGIPHDLREQIFTPFFTTKERGSGTGLGLSIVKRIIQGHDGRILVEEAPHGGARFVIRLPLAG